MRLVSRWQAGVACVAIILLVACGSTPPATISGQIRDSYTNQPIEGAQITFGTAAGLATDAQGHYQTQSWHPQDVAVIQATGYETRTLRLAERPELSKAGSTSASLDVTLRPNSLTGLVRDAFTQEPLADAQVKVSDSISVTTDTDGQYELDGVPEAFEVTVSAPDHETTKLDIRRATKQNLDLQPTALIGMVTNLLTTKPVSGVQVSLGDARATTDTDGQFSLKNIPPDGQFVFSHAGYAQLEMPLDRSATIDVVMRPTTVDGIISDTQSGKVLSDTLVVASLAPTGTLVTQARTDAQGHFHLEQLPEGVALQISHPGYQSLSVPLTAGALKDGIKLVPAAAQSYKPIPHIMVSMGRIVPSG